MLKLAYSTKLGKCYNGKVEEVLLDKRIQRKKGKVDLIFTSPPFPLNRKKKYGNLQGEEYIKWFANLSNLFKEYLSPTGSIVIELGNSWQPGSPTMSTLSTRSFLEFMDVGKLNLCQKFIWYNPAKLPSPAQWVTVDRIRVKDSYTEFWWLSPSNRPKANNRNVLTEYSKSMKSLIKKKQYNAGTRPSEHNINPVSFTIDNGGAIPPNVLTVSNTASGSSYFKYCKSHNINPHPARMPQQLVEFFVKFLTDEGDLVLEPFGGSNTTGSVAEKLNRKWITVEPMREYLHGSIGRFENIITNNIIENV